MSIRTTALVAILVAAGAAFLLATGAPTQAEDTATHHTVFISVTGRGPTAMGWYKGAPPAGNLLQDALDRFSEQGYRVIAIRPAQPDMVTVVSPSGVIDESSLRADAYIILMEK
jgi:hypothetical protein